VNDAANIPRSKLARGAVVGATAARVGAAKAAHLGTRPFISKQRRHEADAKSDEEIARIIFNALCVLRGTALKAAQLVAMEIDWLPEAYQKELAKSSSQVSPMNRALIRKTVRGELGPPEKLFDCFSLTPFAAASLGQVHGAKSKEGRDLAVKIQYPGMAEGVKADIDLLKGVLTPTKYKRVFKECFGEIQRKVSEELDYRTEATRTGYFKEVTTKEHFALPDVLDELSTERVLTTERIAGLHLGQWLETNPSKAERNHFGQLLVDFFNHATFKLRRIHADPNPGNFLFREDGRLGIIDFGCTAELEPPFVEALEKLLRTGDNIEADVEEQAHKVMGIHYRHASDSEEFASFMKGWVKWLGEPYAEEGYDFGENADYFKRGLAYSNQFGRYIDHYDSGFIYYGRTLHGLLRLLQRLGARVNMTPDC
jgi:predicted unusual protein kinase regulating ubiquinone biosynthesis (AarF/ABC1/UbiB family)